MPSQPRTSDQGQTQAIVSEVRLAVRDIWHTMDWAGIGVGGGWGVGGWGVGGGGGGWRKCGRR